MRRSHHMTAEEGLLASRPHPDNVRTCPDCGGSTTVHDTRWCNEFGWTTVRRRRDCSDCGQRTFTIEIQEDAYSRFRRASKQVRETLRRALDDMENLR